MEVREVNGKFGKFLRSGKKLKFWIKVGKTNNYEYVPEACVVQQYVLTTALSLWKILFYYYLELTKLFTQFINIGHQA